MISQKHITIYQQFQKGLITIILLLSLLSLSNYSSVSPTVRQNRTTELLFKNETKTLADEMVSFVIASHGEKHKQTNKLFLQKILFSYNLSVKVKRCINEKELFDIKPITLEQIYSIARHACSEENSPSIS